MRRLDIGVASYRNPEKLRATLASIEAMSTTDWKCFIVHQQSPDDALAMEYAMGAMDRNRRFSIIENTAGGYAAALWWMRKYPSEQWPELATED